MPICSDPPTCQQQVDVMKNTFLQLGYPIHVVDRALSVAKRRFISPKPDSSKNDSVPFIHTFNTATSIIHDVRQKNMHMLAADRDLV